MAASIRQFASDIILSRLRRVSTSIPPFDASNVQIFLFPSLDFMLAPGSWLKLWPA